MPRGTAGREPLALGTPILGTAIVSLGHRLNDPGTPALWFLCAAAHCLPSGLRRGRLPGRGAEAPRDPRRGRSYSVVLREGGRRDGRAGASFAFAGPRAGVVALHRCTQGGPLTTQ